MKPFLVFGASVAVGVLSAYVVLSYLRWKLRALAAEAESDEMFQGTLALASMTVEFFDRHYESTPEIEGMRTWLNDELSKIIEK